MILMDIVKIDNQHINYCEEFMKDNNLKDEEVFKLKGVGGKFRFKNFDLEEEFEMSYGNDIFGESYRHMLIGLLTGKYKVIKGGFYE